MSEVGFVPYFEDISIEYDPGTTTAVTLHNGSKIVLTKMAEDYVPTDRIKALQVLHETARRGGYAPGVLFIEPNKQDFVDILGIPDEPPAFLGQSNVQPSKQALDQIVESVRQLPR